ncbi:imidazole glycerol phosphate synthase [Alkalihalobacillus alcalophilus ATCC 27647 = CGMCC 1.3604]|uniref:Imidazole glycerol phosphate synthase subunit HisH n=1 Tax=Alkalihalobacillus alcalophilus ATCC 27647 = CGMCC 1.3604 TaxID=1218173 RepID=A0A094YVK9_ALKAL|nr:imidazole glycerol phosphate synthase subunit HisH [Alkalihalobacillus alcalophilus]KGA97552.1 imidazole glycerol phosphate synthase [Alkalihalobacillus alcalophilus ATCC 27647 = CGMCC 1.3604]MED1562984.1 imidazole glycerol phosphate synthase subunit HisH [Alkalihalobacillus alcalophilus]THG91119.1 imidazole glycerol phosphate synthase [Alkalihalobacillus alcalophilus ATCC 27647 = CGMCC 1.3604]
MIGIVDYGMGNLHSVSKALERLGYKYIISEKIEELVEMDGLILPGVGAFPDAMEILQETGLAAFLQDWTYAKKPLLGICLGMQLLFQESTEHGQTKGIGLLPGRVERFSGVTPEGKTYKVPHMGWNLLHFTEREHPLLENVEEGHVYFVHSYVVKTEDPSVLVATAEYDGPVPAVVARGSVMATQFHPEKSSEVGMQILKNFGKIVEEEAERE